MTGGLPQGPDDDSKRGRRIWPAISKHCGPCPEIGWRRSAAIAPGQYSIRINEQWRICFEWPVDAPGPSNVEIVDYH